MLQLLKGLQHLLGARAHGNVLGEIHPANDAVGINQKFGWTRDVRAFRTGAGMQYIVPANNLRIRIGQQRKRVPKLLRFPLVNIRRIDANADNTNAARLELRQPLLETPQLGVA